MSDNEKKDNSIYCKIYRLGDVIKNNFLSISVIFLLILIIVFVMFNTFYYYAKEIGLLEFITFDNVFDNDSKTILINEFKDISSLGGILGTFGDFFGGLLNPFLSFFSIIFVVFALMQNSKMIKQNTEMMEQSRKELKKTLDITKQQLDLTKKQLENSEELNKEQSKHLENERTNSHFFKLLDLFISNRELLKKDKLKGREVFQAVEDYTKTDLRTHSSIEAFLKKFEDNLSGSEAYIASIVSICHFLKKSLDEDNRLLDNSTFQSLFTVGEVLYILFKMKNILALRENEVFQLFKSSVFDKQLEDKNDKYYQSFKEYIES